MGVGGMGVEKKLSSFNRPNYELHPSFNGQHTMSCTLESLPLHLRC